MAYRLPKRARETRPPNPSTAQKCDTVSVAAGPHSWASSLGVRRSMQSNRPRDTQPEVLLRCSLHHAGIRFFKHTRPVIGVRCEADLVFPRKRLAVFVDGCFWHGCPLHATWPATNREFWQQKLTRNRARDRTYDRALVDAGWHVLRLWEHMSLVDMHRSVVEELHAIECTSESR
jgi:DNA mismatch endonuclease (patch repair protein)